MAKQMTAPINMSSCRFNAGGSSRLEVRQRRYDVLCHSPALFQASSKGELGFRMILIGGKFEVSSSFVRIYINSVTFHKAPGITELGVRIILISRKFVISSSFSRIYINSITFRKAQCIIELGVSMILIGGKFVI
jgi:hypothetical protein